MNAGEVLRLVVIVALGSAFASILVAYPPLLGAVVGALIALWLVQRARARRSSSKLAVEVTYGTEAPPSAAMRSTNVVPLRPRVWRGGARRL